MISLLQYVGAALVVVVVLLGYNWTASPAGKLDATCGTTPKPSVIRSVASLKRNASSIRWRRSRTTCGGADASVGYAARDGSGDSGLAPGRHQQPEGSIDGSGIQASGKGTQSVAAALPHVQRRILRSRQMWHGSLPAI